MIWTIFLLLAGVALLVAGAEFLVRGAAALAVRFKVSPFLIGLVLVGFGTSAPELVASLEAALEGYPGLAVGNVVGSNIVNILLILGVSGLICPLCCPHGQLFRDGWMLLIATALLIGACLIDGLGRVTGGVFLVLLMAYLVYTCREDKKGLDETARMHVQEGAFAAAGPRFGLVLDSVQAAGGLAALVIGASLLVDSAVDIATMTGVSDTLIGLTVVALGTSLPELATSVVAAFRRNADIAIGNVIGSNIFNALGIMGMVALVKPIPVPPEIASFDIWVMAGATAALLYFAFSGARIGTLGGGLLVAGYGAYLWALAS